MICPNCGSNDTFTSIYFFDGNYKCEKCDLYFFLNEKTNNWEIVEENELEED